MMMVNPEGILIVNFPKLNLSCITIAMMASVYSHVSFAMLANNDQGLGY